MLPETRRQQLDGIVSQMVANKESDANIQFVVGDFKKKYSSESSKQTTLPQKKPGIIQSIAQSVAHPFLEGASSVVGGANAVAGLFGDKKAQARSETIKKEGINFGPLGNARPIGADFDVKNPTAQNVRPLLSAAGTGAEIASNFVGGEGVGALAKTGVKGLVKQGVKQGLKYGALSGALQGAGQSLQDPNASALSVVGNTALGGTVGTLTGGVLGGTTAALGSGVRKAVGVFDKDLRAQKALNEAFDITKPVLNKKDSVAAFERTGQVDALGRPQGVIKKGILGTYDVTPTPRQLEIANSVKHIVSIKKGPLDNIANVNGEIHRISEQEITPFLQKNPAAFNVKTLNSHLRGTIEIPDSIKADPVLQKSYDLARQRMLDVVEKHPKTSLGLWNARKEFDSIAEKQMGNLDPFSEKATTIKQAVLDTRKAVNDFIAENTPNGDQLFKNKLRTLSHMYEARGNIAEQNAKLLGKNYVTKWMKQNPGKVGLIKWGLGLGGSGLILKGVIGD